MCAQVLFVLLFACQIIFNESTVIRVDSDSAGIETTETIQPTTRQDGYTEFTDVHAAYKVHENEETSWNEAHDLCAAEGAHLAIVDSVAKAIHINSLRTKKDENKWLHVGIYKSESTNEWVRVDNGRSPISIPWMDDNPDGAGDCSGIAIYANRLVDYRCEWGGEYCVCEKPLEQVPATGI